MPTQGFNIKSLMQDNFKLNVWDIGGQKSIRPYWRNYFDQTDALIYVIDAVDTRRIEETVTELGQLLDEAKLQNIPVLIFANKCDLSSAMNSEEITDELPKEQFLNRPWKVVACSAKSGEGLSEGMEWLVTELNNAERS
mmetsp:Transcript_14443/g.51352  ORF Transcript_14443/g.51352 Transcript_14443/m.51352 type:complete len:139 (-) Transcript_14443:225-641(-)